MTTFAVVLHWAQEADDATRNSVLGPAATIIGVLVGVVMLARSGRKWVERTVLNTALNTGNGRTVGSYVHLTYMELNKVKALAKEAKQLSEDNNRRLDDIERHLGRKG